MVGGRLLAAKSSQIMFRKLIFAVLMLASAQQRVLAHGVEHHADSEPVGPRNWHELARAWEFDPWVIVPLAVTGLLYARGLVRMWRDAGYGHGIRTWEAACFTGGWLALVIALVSPLHPWGNVLFSAHMTQHELLMLGAAPLLVLGKPLVAFLKTLPPRTARALSAWTTAVWWQSTWRVLVNPFVAWLIHALALWVWHIPVLFDATLHNDFIHALQHLSFVLSALLFWWAIMGGAHRAI